MLKMKTIIKIVLMSVCITVCFQTFSENQNACRRIKSLDKEITPPPGVNTEALFLNIWAFLNILELSPQVLAKAYPRLSDICFKSFSDCKMDEAEYNEVVSHISTMSGIALEEFSEYRSYDMRYDLVKIQDMLGTFKEEFLSTLNISGDMEPIFEMFQSLIITEYVAEQARHALGEDPSRREHVLNLFLWILTGNQNISRADRGGDILENNKDFILENNSDIVAYALVQIFSHRQKRLDELIAKKLSILEGEEADSGPNQDSLRGLSSMIKEVELDTMWHAGLIYNLLDRVSLQDKLREVRTKIENMIIDQNIKDKILSHFPRFIP